MNEKPDGMPNPLNPGAGNAPDMGGETLDANPSEPFSTAGRPRPIRRAPGARPATQMSNSLDPMMSSPRTSSSVGGGSAMPEFSGGDPGGSMPNDGMQDDPLSRPMEAMPIQAPVEPPKKKKTGLIIGIIIALVLIIGGVVAAILLLGQNKGDAVSKAVAKAFSGEMPEKVATEGTIELTANGEASGLSNMKIDLKSDSFSNSLVNSTTAAITAGLPDGNELSFNVEGIYAPSGDVYLKVDGIAETIQNYLETLKSNTGETTTNCIDDGTGMTNCESTEAIDPMAGTEGETTDVTSSIFGPFSTLLETIDGKYLKLSVEELNQTAGGMGTNVTQCFSELTDNIKNNRNVIADAYTANPFISSTKEGVNIQSATGNPVYKVSIDQEKLKSFNNALGSSSFVKNFMRCMNANLSDADLSNSENLPTIYAEVDSDYNFTRIYVEGETKADNGSEVEVYDESAYSTEDEEYVMAEGESADVAIYDDEAVTDDEASVDISVSPDEVSVDETESSDNAPVLINPAPAVTYNLVVDLRFTYPSTINVVEPEDAIDMLQLQQLLISAFGQPEGDVTPTE